jgi:hypothetical protein
LTPAIYDPGGRNTDQWWHFTTIETLQKELLDIYDKLINFGIPYLEDLNSKDVELKFYGKPKEH